MSVVIRLSRHGKKKMPFYRMVAADKEMKRDGRYLELLGTVNPLTEPATIALKEDRIRYWLGVGAKPSTSCQTVIERILPGHYKAMVTNQRAKIIASRKARKARAGKGATKSTAKAKAAPKAKK